MFYLDPCLEAAPPRPNLTQLSTGKNSASDSSLIQTLKQRGQHCTREGRKAHDLISQQFATLVLHPAVNYVPFTVTITADGCRADENTKCAQPSTYGGAETMQNSCNTSTSSSSSFLTKYRMFLQIKRSPESYISKGRCSGSLPGGFSLQVPGVERSFIIPQLSVINETIEYPN